MLTITIDVDETLQAQVVYCPDLDVYLRIYALQQSDIDAEVQDAQAKIDVLQNSIKSTMTLIEAKQNARTPPTQELGS